MNLREVVIPTTIDAYGGTLKDTPAADLGAVVAVISHKLYASHVKG